MEEKLARLEEQMKRLLADFCDASGKNEGLRKENERLLNELMEKTRRLEVSEERDSMLMEAQSDKRRLEQKHRDIRKEAERLLQDLPGWELTEDGKRIRREWTVKHFMAAMDFFNRVAQLAEDEGHHPDLHLVAYRSVAIELWTHAIGGLSENDFITAAKIDELPIKLKSG